jgi:hypothetical protein
LQGPHGRNYLQAVAAAAVANAALRKTWSRSSVRYVDWADTVGMTKSKNSYCIFQFILVEQNKCNAKTWGNTSGGPQTIAYYMLRLSVMDTEISILIYIIYIVSNYS